MGCQEALRRWNTDHVPRTMCHVPWVMCDVKGMLTPPTQGKSRRGLAMVAHWQWDLPAKCLSPQTPTRPKQPSTNTRMGRKQPAHAGGLLRRAPGGGWGKSIVHRLRRLAQIFLGENLFLRNLPAHRAPRFA